MALILDGTNTPTLGGVGYGDGTELAFTSAGSAGGVLYSAGGAAPVFSAAGTAGQVLTSAGASAPTWVTPGGGYTLGTPVVTTSGAYATFTGIPAGVKNIIITFFGVSSSATFPLAVQFGTSSAFVTSGYKSVGSSASVGSGTFTFDDSQADFQLTNAVVTSDFLEGSVNFTLQDSANNYWTSQGTLCSQGSQKLFLSAGSLNLAAVLTRLRVTFVADFDAGQINIAYL